MTFSLFIAAVVQVLPFEIIITDAPTDPVTLSAVGEKQLVSPGRLFYNSLLGETGSDHISIMLEGDLCHNGRPNFGGFFLEAEGGLRLTQPVSYTCPSPAGDLPIEHLVITDRWTWIDIDGVAVKLHTNDNAEDGARLETTVLYGDPNAFRFFRVIQAPWPFNLIVPNEIEIDHSRVWPHHNIPLTRIIVHNP